MSGISHTLFFQMESPNVVPRLTEEVLSLGSRQCKALSIGMQQDRAEMGSPSSPPAERSVEAVHQWL